jgi:hypothetical protein
LKTLYSDDDKATLKNRLDVLLGANHV